MKKIALVRGAYMNPFETQNYIGDIDTAYTGISSKYPIGAPPFPLRKLWSLSDISEIPPLKTAVRYIANRTLGDQQILLGLESMAHDFDIFHSADPHYYYSYQLARLRQTRTITKLLLTSWETIPHNNESTAAKKRIKYFSLIHADKILTYTKKAKDALLREGVPTKKIITVPFAVDTNLFSPLRLNIRELKTLLFVGRLVKEKGVLDVYEAFSRIAASFRDYQLRIVGTGPLETILRQMAHRDRLGDRVIIENKKYSDMPDVYRESTIGVFPSVSTKTWEEQYGMVILEALSSGLPIITTRSGAIPEVAGNVCVYVEESNPAILANKIQNMLTDKSHMRKIGTMGRRRAETQFNRRLFNQSIKNLYKSL